MARRIPLILFGTGQVGRALVAMVLGTRARQAALELYLDFVALADREGALVDERGLDEPVVDSALRLKARGASLATHERGYYQSDLAALVDVAGQADAIVIDTTDATTELIMPALVAARRFGYGVVLANKKPLTATLAEFEQLVRRPGTEEGRADCGYEATVGAGLPVIRILRMLLETGDEVQAIRGAFSGTLGYLMTELQAGVPFSVAVREAKRLGYTEPDPRDDLSGADVARKALILARTLGLPLEMADVAVEPLFPPAFADLDVPLFLERFVELDEAMAARASEAAAEGSVLRYIAAVTPDGLRVGLSAEPMRSALGALRGPDNLVAFHTDRYSRTPLVIQGAGAGAEVTASAILADILALATPGWL
ncbi:MAG TPA: homoserine dehydrogenase [Chloroflexi bacterium]|nr:homoserine dehydrogenase [Chloroflexota bacterium]